MSVNTPIDADIPAAQAPGAWPSASYAWYVVFVLSLANTLAFIDRSILSLLIEPIQRDLGVNDTLMGLLHGFSFALFYSFLGFPIARLADRANRRNIIAVGVAVWSLMTAFCGLARTYWFLFAARVGVGAGEAALSPSAYSIMADYFPPNRLPRAMSVFAIGIYIGNGLALMFGGAIIAGIASVDTLSLPFIGEIAPWQMAFLAVGIPGILFSGLVMTIKEPVRRLEGTAGKVSASSPSVSEVFEHFWGRRGAYLSIFLGFAILILLGYGNSAWVPTFFIRTFNLSIPDIGLIYGLIVLVFGGAGAVSGGWFATFLSDRGRKDASLLAALAGALALGPVWVAASLAPTAWSALLLMGLVNFFSAFPFGGGFSAVQEITPNRMRAQISAGLLFFINLVGVGLGPTVVGLLTDFVFQDPGQIRYSLAIASAVFAPLGALILWLGLKPFVQASSAMSQKGAGA